MRHFSRRIKAMRSVVCRRAIVTLILLVAFSSFLFNRSRRIVTTEECGCIRHVSVRGAAVKTSTCNDFVTELGTGQNVVAYSLYKPIRAVEAVDPNAPKNTITRFFGLLPTLAQRILTVYPDFRMRIYHNISADDDLGQELCNLYCQHDHVDLCNVSSSSDIFGQNLNRKFTIGRFWRFAAVADETVDILLVRDVDSLILRREIAVVHQWLKDDSKLFHVMRDSPTHRTEILAGLWGIKNYLSTGLSQEVRKALFEVPIVLDKGYDQRVLAKRVWPLVRNVTLIHDSYYCDSPTLNYHAEVQPFLTKRHNRCYYVGYGPSRENIMLERIKAAPCPYQCRPLNHLDWTHC